jgi:O-acetyl-ADP-ribose deacetylase (regulator of RNase III)
MDRAAWIAVRETNIFLERDQPVERVILVCFGANALDTYRLALREI